jgi:hypothetical protein
MSLLVGMAKLYLVEIDKSTREFFGFAKEEGKCDTWGFQTC